MFSMTSREQEIINGFDFQNPDILRGDDAATVPLSDHSLVVSQDTLCEGVHFDLAFCTPEDVAHRAIHANLSDMAAMGLNGHMVLQSVAIPKQLSGEWIQRYIQAFNALMKAHHLTLIGGDVCHSQHGLMITITIMDECSKDMAISRHGAIPGDLIAVTKPPGFAALGLEALKRNHNTSDSALFKACFLRPEAQNALACDVRHTGYVHAMLDSSDGLVDSLNHLIECSQVGITIDVDQLPSTPEFIKTCEHFELDPISLQLNGGEDFGLVMSIHADLLEHVPPNTIYPIGHVTDEATLKLMHHGQPYSIGKTGFSHFE